MIMYKNGNDIEVVIYMLYQFHMVLGFNTKL